MYGLARGKGIIEEETVLFVLTTSSSSEFVNTPEFNILKEGKANNLIFNNNVSIANTLASVNEGNRVVIAADFFYVKNRVLSFDQNV